MFRHFYTIHSTLYTLFHINNAIEWLIITHTHVYSFIRTYNIILELQLSFILFLIVFI